MIDQVTKKTNFTPKRPIHAAMLFHRKYMKSSVDECKMIKF